MAIIDDGVYEWEEVYKDLIEYTEKYTFKNSDYKVVYEEIKTFKEFIYDYLHTHLYEHIELKENEEQSRKICKYVIIKLLPFITKKINEIDSKMNKNNNDMDLALLYKDYLELEDDLYAIASYRSLTHFAYYMERQDDDSQIVWKYNLKDTMGGIFYYSNMMILNNECEIQNLIKQCPTGYGKCIDENTNVFTPNGNVKIKDINVGDCVYSMKDNEIVKRKVLNKWNTTKKQVKIITRNGKEIITSKEHRMFTQRGYVASENLTTNDYLYALLLGRFFYDKIVSIEYIDEEIPMVDIEVEETHNFIANGLVSHNSKSDCTIIAFCFGYNPSDDIMKIVGNPSLVKPITQSIVKMLKSDRFSKVFPLFSKYNGKDKNDMFKNCAETEGTFTLADSKKSLSFACYNKGTSIDGGRFNKQFYDDVTQSDDRENVNAHMKDRGKYNSQWKKRQYDEFSVKRWFTGTAYHREDFLSYIRKDLANKKELIVDESTKKQLWNKFVRLSEDRKTVYISVPKLADLELGEDKCYCTFPQKYSKVEALKELHGSENAKRRFYAMEQQTPLPPESLGFDHAYLKHYDVLPSEIKEGKCRTIVIIDPNRKGKDNYAGLIFKKPDSEDVYYFVDCFYKKVGSKVAIPQICERASHHKADIISFENNTVDSYQMKKEINEYMAKFGWKEAKVNDFYSVLNKEDKISMHRDDIREKIIFPKQGMYYEDSDMGRAMSDIVNYSFEVKPKNDDSIDCCAMLIEFESKKTQNTIETFDFW